MKMVENLTLKLTFPWSFAYLSWWSLVWEDKGFVNSQLAGLSVWEVNRTAQRIKKAKD